MVHEKVYEGCTDPRGWNGEYPGIDHVARNHPVYFADPLGGTSAHNCRTDNLGCAHRSPQERGAQDNAGGGHLGGNGVHRADFVDLSPQCAD